MKLPPPRATIAIVGVTAAAWLVVASAGLTEQAAGLAGFMPARASGTVALSGAVPVALTPLTATLVHAGIVHLAFNLLMLGFCGRFVETALGRAGVVLTYVVGAYAAAAMQYLIDPAAVTPMIGASGATSALVGAYALLFGKRYARRGPISGEMLQVLWLAAAWIGLQLLVGLASAGSGVLVATGAHVGGFIAGLVVARPILRFRYRNA